MHSNKVKKTVGALIEKNGKFLLLKRANTKTFCDYWTLPAGSVENDENIKDAVKREVKEETNLDFFKPILFKIYYEDFSQFDWKAKTSIFYGEFAGRVRINEESSEFGWFSLDEIKNMKLSFNHKEIIREFVKNGN